jgi:hypothetical protein
MAILTSFKNFSLIIEADNKSSEQMKEKIVTLDAKVQQMLLWSNLSAIWGYLLLMFTIIKIYMKFNGAHAPLLVLTLSLIVMLLAIYLFVVWKSMGYTARYTGVTGKVYLNYQIDKLHGQRKLITAYVIANTLFLAITSTFFVLDAQNGIMSFLKMVAPISLVLYVLGLYFIIKFAVQKSRLDVMNKQIDKIILNDKVQQN